MSKCALFVLVLILAVAGCASQSPSTGGLQSGAGSAIGALTVPLKAEIINGADGLPRMGELFDTVWNPAVSAERSRGGTEAVYPKVAPAVVVIKLPGGYGSGFVIDGDGWIVTNRHVVAEAAMDPANGAQCVEVLFGKMEDGWMKLLPKPVSAYVYKVSDKDLALLKVATKPEGIEQFATLAFAKDVPRPGGECVVFGHPAAGALWSVRGGEITGMGTWPDDKIDVALRSLSATGKDADQLQLQLKNAPKQKVLYSNVGVNVGDSGGPLVNSSGEVVGVTFAMPAFNPQELGRQGTTSYHVHVDEVRQFVADKPAKPICITDPWPDAALAGFMRLAKEGQNDALVFGPSRGALWVAMLIDLNQQSPSDLSIQQLADPKQRGRWQFQLAIHRIGSVVRAYYDTAGAGKIDLIVTGDGMDAAAQAAVRLTAGGWKTEDAHGHKVLDPSFFSDGKLQKKMTAVLD